MSAQRVKLDTAIEREVHRLIKNISEGVYDGVQLYARRNNLPVEPELLSHILKTVQIIINEHELKHIDSFHNNIKQQLDDYTGDENPTETPAPKASSPKNKKTAEAQI
jgi:hypothetical protein